MSTHRRPAAPQDPAKRADPSTCQAVRRPGSESRPTADVIIVGGGVAGLSAAYALARHELRVLLLEREPRLATQASGNNAAIFRPLEHDAVSCELPRRSRQLLDAWFGPQLLDVTGLLLVSDSAAPVQRLAAAAVGGNVAHTRLDRAELHALAPSLRGGESSHALLLHDAGVLDVPAFTSRLGELARSDGAILRTAVAVQSIAQARGRVTGVTLADGTRLEAPCVVVAAGAWNASLGEASGASIPLAPMRRHLVELRTRADLLDPEPVVWRLEDEVYFRKRGSNLLASPCDETLSSLSVASMSYASDPMVPAALNAKLKRVAPALSDGSLVRAWACLRTFAPDHELVVGADPRVQGLHWFGGLGGRGMSVALAAAEILAACIVDDTLPPLAAALSPARLLRAQKSADRTA